MNLNMLMPDFGTLVPMTIACIVILVAPMVVALWTVGTAWVRGVVWPSGQQLILNVALAAIFVTVMFVANIGTIYKVVEAAYWVVVMIFIGFALAVCCRIVTRQCSYAFQYIRRPRRTRD